MMFGNEKSAEQRQKEKERRKRIRCAIQGFRERDRSYLTCKIGLPVNAAALIIFLAIFIGGLN